jgi:hypothetical protein
MEVSYFIAGQEVHQPINYPELSIELNYDKDDSLNQAVSLTEFEWGVGSKIDGDDAAKLINDYLNNGNVFEGLPIQVELTNNSTSYIIFDGYLDASKAIYECDKVIVQGVQKKNIDWINEVFDSKSFRYIYEKEGIILDSDFVNVPYVLSSIPNGYDSLLASISLFFVVRTILTEIEGIKRDTVGVGALAWEDVAKLVFRVIYIIGLLILLVKLVLEIIDLLIQPIKYHAAMSELKHLQRACESFGFTFKSSILENAPYNKSYIIPEKYNMEVGTTNNGNYLFGNKNKTTINTGFFNGTVGDLFRILKRKYNAKIIIDGDILRLERRDFPNSSNNYIIPPVDQDAFTLNSDELKSNYVVRFQTDTNDRNTLQDFEGTVTQVTTTPIAGRTDYTILSGLQEENIDFARASIKDSYTNVELIVRAILQQFDAVVNTAAFVGNQAIIAVNNAKKGIKKVFKFLTGKKFKDDPIPLIKTTDTSGFIDERIGMMLMENDFISIAKNVILEDGTYKVSTDDALYTNSEYIYNNFHFIESFVPTTSKPNGNQYKIYEVEGVPFCFEDYEKFLTSNFLKDSEGRNGELISLRWDINSQTATINYKISELYTNKLKEEIITPDGR